MAFPRGRLVAGRQACQLPRGGRVAFVEWPAIGERIWIRFDNLGTLEGTARWLDGHTGGVQFERPLPEAQSSADTVLFYNRRPTFTDVRFTIAPAGLGYGRSRWVAIGRFVLPSSTYLVAMRKRGSRPRSTQASSARRTS